MTKRKLKPERPTKRERKAAKAMKAQAQAANPEDTPAQPEFQHVKKKVTNAERVALGEDGNPRPGAEGCLTNAGKHTYPGIEIPRRSRAPHAIPIRRHTPEAGEVRKSDALIKAACWYYADGPPTKTIEPVQRPNWDNFRLQVRTRQGYRDDLVLAIRKGRQVYVELDLNHQERTFSLVLSDHQYRVEVAHMEHGQVVTRYELWLLGTTVEGARRVGGLFEHLRGAMRAASPLSRITYTNVPRKLPRTAPSSDVRTSTRNATTSIQQEENKDAPEWNIYLPRSGITWTFRGFLGLNKDKIDQLEREWNNDGRGALGTDTGADNPTEADHEPAKAPEEENLQHEDAIPPLGSSSSTPPNTVVSAPQDAGQNTSRSSYLETARSMPKNPLLNVQVHSQLMI